VVYYQTLRDIAVNELIQHWLSDTAAVKTDSIIAFLKTQNDVGSKQQLLQYYLTNNQCNDAATLLNQLPKNDLNDSMFYDYNKILQQLCANGLTINALTAAQKQKIEAIAHTNTVVAGNAKALLNFVYNESYPEIFEDLIVPENLTIRGHLYLSSSCGGAPIANADILLISSVNDTIRTLGRTDTSGKFVCDLGQLVNLPPTQTYIFATQQGYKLEPQQAKTIDSLMSESNIELHIAPPQVLIATDTLICLGNTSYFNSEISGGVPPYAYLWSCGPVSSNAESPEYKLPAPGSYTVVLSINDALACPCSDTIIIDVDLCEPPYGFLYHNNACGGEAVANDTLLLIQSESDYPMVLQAISQQDGSFSFDALEVAELKTNALYYIASLSGMGIENMQARTIDEWRQLNPLYLNYSARVEQEWLARYYGTDSSGAYPVTMDINDNIYIAGKTNLNMQQDYFVLKYNPSGVLQWAATYNGTASNSDVANAITVDDAQNVYVTGTAINTNTGSDIVTLKYNAVGQQQWVKAYNSTANAADAGNFISIAPDGHIVVGGSSTTDTLLGHLSSVIIKYTSDGQELWRKIYNTPGESNGITSLAVNDEAHIIVGGWIVKNTDDIDYMCVKFDSEGNVLWERRYNGLASSIDYTHDGTLDAEQNFIVTGFSTDMNNTKEIRTIKYDTAGNTLWEVAYNSEDKMDAEGTFVMADVSGNIYVCGNSYNDYGAYQPLLIKYDSYGNELWVNTDEQGNNNNNYIISATVDMAGDVYISGFISTQATYEYFIAKCNSEGVYQWFKKIPADIKYIKVLVSSIGDVYATGAGLDILNGIFNASTLKYTQCPSVVQNFKIQHTETTVAEETEYMNEKFTLNVMPNPYKSHTNIVLEIFEESKIQIDVYTLAGQKVQEIINNKQEAGYYHYTFSAQKLGFTPGLYMLRIRINDETQNFKLIELKY